MIDLLRSEQARRNREDGRRRRSVPRRSDGDGARRRGRLARPAVPVLPPRSRPDRAGGAHAAGRRRPEHRRDRPCVPRARGHDGAADHPGQATDQGVRRPVPRCRRQRIATSRRDAVLQTLYLIFNEGYTSSSGPALHRTELSAEAIRLTRMAHRLLPDDGEVAGLLALMLLTDARRPARIGADGALVPMAEQDRGRWDRGGHRRGHRAGHPRDVAGTPGPVPTPGRDRRRARRGGAGRADRLGRRSSRSTRCSTG